MTHVKSYNELELKDDFMFGKVMGNRALCKKLLETLLETDITEITYPEREKFIQITRDEKNVRLDVYVKDGDSRVYDAEMQRKHKTEDIRNLPKRSRYYQGIIDLNLLESGMEYGELPESYVIFICTFDPFGQGKSRYIFQNLCMEDKETELADGTTKIFFNTKGDEEGISEETKFLLRYIESNKAENAFTRELDKEVCRVRRNVEWRREYMKSILFWEETRIEARREGLAEGREEGLEQGIRVFLEFCREMDLSREAAEDKVKTKFELNEEAARGYLKKYWE